MKVNYDGRVFRVRDNTSTGEVGDETRLHYRQDGDRLTGTYEGGSIRRGHLLGHVFEDGRLEFTYHHENTEGELKAGRCESVPSRTDDGRLVRTEHWEWLTDDRSSGTSVIVEVEEASS